MDESNHGLLHAAIARSAGAVLSLPTEAGLRHVRTRFLAEAVTGESSAKPALWIELVSAERSAIEALLQSQGLVGVSFKSAGQKISFATTLSRREREFEVNAGSIVEALLLPFPAAIRTIQRRKDYRTAVGVGAKLSVRAWRIGPRSHLNDRPAASQEVKVRLRDLSVGGAGMSFTGRDGNAPVIALDERLRIEITFGEADPILLDGLVLHLRHDNAQDGTMRDAGIRFRGLNDDVDGRRKLSALTKIVGELQRVEVRRSRAEAA